MNIRNLTIFDSNLPNKDKIIDGIQELDLVISDNFNLLSDKETAIEFNIGSQVGSIKKYFVIYNNPSFKNNPYYYILEFDQNQQKLVKETSLDTFIDLEDKDTRRFFHHKIVTGFRNLPKHAFLSQHQIEHARELSNDYDKYNTEMNF